MAAIRSPAPSAMPCSTASSRRASSTTSTRWAHLVDVVDEARREDAVEHGIADGAGERIAAIGRAVRAGDHGFGDLALGKAGAERETAADALGDRHDVGCNAAPLMREEFAGAPVAALHLVED